MVDKEIAAALSDDAARQGKSLSYITDDLVRLYLKVREKGYDFGSIIDTFETMTLAKRMGHLLISDEICDIMVGSAAGQRIEKTIQSSRESGQKMARYAEMISSDPVDNLKRLLPNMFWEMSIDLKNDGPNISMYASFPSHAYGRANIVLAFVEGYLEDCSFEVLRKEVMPGLIRAQFQRKSV
jgi:hypothetical protein